jgi:hypothetical protein
LVISEGLTPPILIKIDVEGWEMTIFKGAAELIAKCPPKLIVFENASDKKEGLFRRNPGISDTVPLSTELDPPSFWRT